MVSWALKWVVGIFLALLVLMMLPEAMGLLTICWHLCFGWLAFLGRVLPNAHVNWSGVGLALICSLFIVWGLHSLGAWWYGGRVDSTPAAVVRRWRFTWTISLFCLLWLLFLSAMGITGLAHQLGWLFASGQPFWTGRRAYSSELRRDARNLFHAAETEDWNLSRARKAFIGEPFIPTGKSWQHPVEALHVLFLEGRDGTLAAAVLFHRDEAIRQRVGFMLVSREQAEEARPMHELAAVLARYEQ